MILITTIITTSIVLIWDWFNAPNEIASSLMSAITHGKIRQVELRKPLGCSTCMTFWITLVVLLVYCPSLCWMSLVHAFTVKYILYVINLTDKAITKVFIMIEKTLTIR